MIQYLFHHAAYQPISKHVAQNIITIKMFMSSSILEEGTALLTHREIFAESLPWDSHHAMFWVDYPCLPQLRISVW